MTMLLASSERVLPKHPKIIMICMEEVRGTVPSGSIFNKQTFSAAWLANSFLRSSRKKVTGLHREELTFVSVSFLAVSLVPTTFRVRSR